MTNTDYNQHHRNHTALIIMLGVKLCRDIRDTFPFPTSKRYDHRVLQERKQINVRVSFLFCPLFCYFKIK